MSNGRTESLSHDSNDYIEEHKSRKQSSDLPTTMNAKEDLKSTEHEEDSDSGNDENSNASSRSESPKPKFKKVKRDQHIRRRSSDDDSNEGDAAGQKEKKSHGSRRRRSRSGSRRKKDRSRRSRSGSGHRRRRRSRSGGRRRRSRSRSRKRSHSRGKHKSPKRSRRDSSKTEAKRQSRSRSKEKEKTKSSKDAPSSASQASEPDQSKESRSDKADTDKAKQSSQSRSRKRSSSRSRKRRSRSRSRRPRSHSRRSRSRDRRRRRSRSRSRDRRRKRSNSRSRRRHSRSASTSPYKFGFNKAMDAQERLARRLERAKELTKLKKEEEQKNATSNGLLGLKDDKLKEAIEKAAKMIVSNAAPVNATPQTYVSAQASAQMEALRKQAEKETGVAVPTYYNPLVVNPMMFAQQQAKRNLLWSKKTADTKASEASKDTAAPSSLWSKATLGDEKSDEKFAKLMGIKQKEQVKPDLTDEDVRKRQELFSNLDQQYAQARVVTHTQRGAGLGFAAGNPNTLLAQQAHQQLNPGVSYPPATTAT